MWIEAGRRFAIYSLVEADRLLMPEGWHTIADYSAVQRVGCCKERRRAIAPVNVGTWPQCGYSTGFHLDGLISIADYDY
jgi:hypothetical protein